MQYKFGIKPAPDHWKTEAVLGVNAAGKFTSKDLGKAVTLADDSRYVLAADGDEIEGVVVAMEPHTCNDGLGFGTVQTKGRFVAKAVGGTLAIGALVVVSTQSAVGTEIVRVTTGERTGEIPITVKAGTPTVHIWRVISHYNGGAGAAGTFILIERV